MLLETREQREKTLRDHYPAKRPGPQARGDEATFELAIVLAGAVSAGAYTGGVMDFLCEALDEWYRSKADDVRRGVKGTPQQTVPHHNVVLRVITGASAGGMNGAIAAAAFASDFPHANAARGNSQQLAASPFYDAWVKSIDIEPMLDPSDLSKGLPPALLNCAPLTRIAERIVKFGATGPAPAEGVRDWLADPFELRLTNTNLHGVPFAYELKTGGASAQQGFRMHSDQAAFSISRTSKSKTAARPDCIALSYDEDRNNKRWDALKVAGLATGAFPVALQARDVSVDCDCYNWRLSFFDNEANPNAHVFVSPAWPDGGASSPFPYAAVDGGVMNNEPFEMARAALAGPRGRNNQDGKSADRAVIVVDPFIEKPEPGPTHDAGMLDVAGRLIPLQVNQARLSAQDLVQIQREDVYSRYMIMPKRSVDGRELFGKEALATGELGAFGGFFCEAFRHHDYLLGRRNAQRFLQAAFTLPEDNKLFDGGRWTPQNKEDFADPVAKDGTGKEIRHLQVIPLCNHLKAKEDGTNIQPKAVWPRGAYSAERSARIYGLIEARVNKMWKLAKGEVAASFARDDKQHVADKPGWTKRMKTAFFAFGAGAYLGVGWWFARGSILKWIQRTIDESMDRINKA